MGRFFLAVVLFGVLQSSVAADELDSLLRRAGELTRSGSYEQALPLYQQAFRANPGDLRINYLLGDAAVRSGDYETAVMAFERVLIINPRAVRAKIELGRAFDRLGAAETARQYFMEALREDLPEAVRKDIEERLAP